MFGDYLLKPGDEGWPPTGLVTSFGWFQVGSSIQIPTCLQDHTKRPQCRQKPLFVICRNLTKAIPNPSPRHLKPKFVENLRSNENYSIGHAFDTYGFLKEIICLLKLDKKQAPNPNWSTQERSNPHLAPKVFHGTSKCPWVTKVVTQDPRIDFPGPKITLGVSTQLTNRSSPWQ